MRVVFIVQSLFDGRFIGIQNGQRHYFVNMKHAYRFKDFDDAVNNAKDLDEQLEEIVIHPLIEFN